MIPSLINHQSFKKQKQNIISILVYNLELKLVLKQLLPVSFLSHKEIKTNGSKVFMTNAETVPVNS